MKNVHIQPADLPGPKEQPDELVDRGWVYRGIGWCTPDIWDLLLGVLGEGEFKMLAMSTAPDGARRGQFLFSPVAIANCAEYARQKKAGGQ